MLNSADKKTILTVTVIILIVALLLWLIPGRGGGSGNATITFPNEYEITVDLAITDEEKSKGLGGRREMSDKEGMLFVYDTYVTPSFWMKGMNFDLDLIWIRDDVIVDITENAEASSILTLTTFKPRVAVTDVLEVNAGFAERYSIEIGDRLEIDLP